MIKEEIKDTDIFKLIGKIGNEISMFESKHQEKPSIIIVSYKLQSLLMSVLEISSYTSFGEHKIISLFYGIGLIPSKKLNDLEDGFTSVTNYNDMLDPTNKRLFEKVLNQEVFEDLQQKAQELLDSTPDAHPAFKKHWEMIVSGRVPFGYSKSGNTIKIYTD